MMGHIGMVLLYAVVCSAHEDARSFYHEFVRRPEFASRLLFHPDTGAKLRETPVCNLTGTWSSWTNASSVVQEYFMESLSDGTWTVIAVTANSWASGQGIIDPATGFVHVDLDKSTTQGISLNGTITNCSVMNWDNNTTWSRQQVIKKVHVVFMNHLDIGFAIHTPEGNPIGFMANVINTYTLEYFRSALELSRALKNMGSPYRFVYTTHPWLVSLYIDCPEHVVLANGTKLLCPTAEEMAQFKQAVADGDIVWHNGPFNLQSENVGPPVLFEWGLQLATDIGQKLQTTPASNKVYNLRDVPGTTRAVIPILKKHNFTAITIGQNGGTPTPDGWFPHKIFRWIDEPSGTDILTFNHAGGYPADPGPSADNCQGLCRNDCMMAPGFDEALCFAFRTDNSGPPSSAQEVVNIFSILSVEFPGADILASTLNAFSAAANAKQEVFDVVKSEIGDTWIQGVQSDPAKMAQYRAYARVMEGCAQQGLCNATDFRVLNSTRLSLTLPEHTWGLPGLGDQTNWTNPDFHRFVTTDPTCTANQQSWQEHRTWLQYAVDALEGHPIHDVLQASIEATKGSVPSLSGYQQVNLTEALSCGGVTVQFNANGSISRLLLGGKEWASASNVLGEMVYSTYTETDFNNMAKVYHGPTGGGCGYFKPGMDNAAHPNRTDTQPKLVELWVNKTARGSCSIVAKSMSASDLVSTYGAAAQWWLGVEIVDDLHVNLDLQGFNKTVTRLAEAMHYSFYPVQTPGASWMMDKLGTMISPYETIENGNPKQHAVWNGVFYGGLQIKSLDVAVVSPITAELGPTPFLFDLSPLPVGSVTGMGYNIWNNIWDVNYPLYYPFSPGLGDENVRSRFELSVNATT
ncbi:hypothetical protein DIPPA_29372 [Diplonema papillatum]|nr:hypothetical protein DIPPA_29372 [Diplonema papillatum]